MKIDGLVEVVIDRRPTAFIDSTGVHLLLRQSVRAMDVLPLEPAP